MIKYRILMPLIILRKLHLIDLAFSTRTPLNHVIEYINELRNDGFIKNCDDLIEITNAGLKACLGKFINFKRRSWLIVNGSNDSILNLGFIKSRWGFKFSPLCIPLINLLETFDCQIFIGWSRILSNIWNRICGEITPIKYLFNALNLINEASNLLKITSKWSFNASLMKIKRAIKLINTAKYVAENMIFPKYISSKFPFNIECRSDLIELISKLNQSIKSEFEYIGNLAFKINWSNLIDHN